MFKPQNTKLLAEFNRHYKITDVMKVNVLGFQTHRDNFAVDFEKEKLHQRIMEMRSDDIADHEFIEKYVVKDNRDWKLSEVRSTLKKLKEWKNNIIQCTYRPFDKRFCYFSYIAMDYPRRELLDHVAWKKNICLGLGRQGIAVQDSVWSLISISRDPVDANIFRRGGINLFPLYLYPKAEKKYLFEHSKWPAGDGGRVLNLSPEFVDDLSGKIKLEFVSDGVGDLKKTFGPEDILHYIYAVFHSPEYRKRYAEFLKIDFPRVPMPTGKEIFVGLCGVGERLSKLHLMEADILEDVKRWPDFDIKGSDTVEKGYPKYVAHSDAPQKGKVYINKEQYFEGVRPAVWEFHVGGYQVCEKWLKDRRERKLSYEDISHYQKIVVSLGETIGLMNESCLSEMF